MHGPPGPLAARAGAAPGCRTLAALRPPTGRTFSRSRPREPGGRVAGGGRRSAAAGGRGGQGEGAGRGARAACGGGARGGGGATSPPQPRPPGAARTRAGRNCRAAPWLPPPPLGALLSPCPAPGRARPALWRVRRTFLLLQPAEAGWGRWPEAERLNQWQG